MAETTRIYPGTIIVDENLVTPATIDATHGNIQIGLTNIHDFSKYSTVKNLFAGVNAGNYTMDGSYNTCFGTDAGSNITTGGSNIIMSHGSSALTTGQYNTLFSGAANLTTGNRNLIAGGVAPGSNYTVESDNICLSNAGVTGDQKTIRIGDTHTNCYIAGINGVPVTGSPVFVDSTGHLGVGTSSSLTLAPIGSSPNANGATLTGTTLNLQPASASFGGIVTTGDQTFAGKKTFAVTNVGVNSTTGTDLAFPSAVKNKKINMYPMGADDNEHQYYGFGINPSLLRYQVYNTSADHAFYAGTSTTTSNELFRIKGTGGITLPTSGGTPSVLNFYQTTNLSSSFICGTSPNVTTTAIVDIQLERIGSTVTIRIPSALGTYSSAGTFNMPSDKVLPTNFRPAQVVQWPAVVINAGSTVYGRVQIQTGGGIQISVGPSQGNFTGGSIGWPSSLCYTYLVI